MKLHTRLTFCQTNLIDFSAQATSAVCGWFHSGVFGVGGGGRVMSESRARRVPLRPICLTGPTVMDTARQFEGGRRIPTSVLTTIPQRKWTVIALKQAGDKRGGRRGHLT